jgi:hypothetical protein
VISVGVGEYPSPEPPLFSKARWLRYLLSVQLLQRTLEINTQSMDQLRVILFETVPTIRISDAFTQPEMATDLFEHDLAKLRTGRVFRVITDKFFITDNFAAPNSSMISRARVYAGARKRAADAVSLLPT